MSLSRAAMYRMNKLLAADLSDALFRDNDPWNTEWSIAVRAASKHYRKRRRKFFDLWLDELMEHRNILGCEGLAAVLSGGDRIASPLIRV